MGGKPVILGGDSAMRIVVLEGSPNKKGSMQIFIPVRAVCAVDMKVHASRRMIWSGFGNRS